MLSIKVADKLLDTDKSTSIGFKFTSGWVDGIQSNGKYRTFDFSVPATANNNRILEHTNNTAFDGMRQGVPAVIGDGGVWMDGTLYLRSSSKDRHNLLFIHGRKALGLGISRPIGVFNDTISVRDKMAPNFGGTIPNFGFYSYQNGLGNTQAITLPLDHMPCVNLGYWLDTMASVAGYTVSWPANSGWYSPYSYGFMLPSANTYNEEEIVISGSGHGGWSYTITSGNTLADCGLTITTERFKRGNLNENVTVYVFKAIRHVVVQVQTQNVYALHGNGYESYTHEEIGGPMTTMEFELDADDYMSFATSADLNANRNKWWGGWHFPAGFEIHMSVTLKILTDEEVVQDGQTLTLEQNLPDLTLEEGLNAFCDIIAGTYTVDTTTMTITVTTLSAALESMSVGLDLNTERVASIGEVKPYIEGWAQHNRVVCESADYVTEGKRFKRDYPCNNAYLENDAEIATIPFNEGNWESYRVVNTYYKTIYLEDITAGDDGTNDYKGELTIFCEAPANVPALHLTTTTDDGVGQDYGRFTANTITLEVSARLPLYKFLQIYTGTLIHFGSRDWVVRSANWSGGVVSMTLLSYIKPQRELPDALNFTMPNGGDIAFTYSQSFTLEYTLDGGETWTDWAKNNSQSTLTLAAGQKVYIRNKITYTPTPTLELGMFSFTDTVEAAGPVDSMLATDPNDAVLTSGCYGMMFANCTTLVTAPELRNMTLPDMCYFDMFDGCTALTSAPALPALTLAEACYQMIFAGCSSLAEVRLSATDITATDCLDNWLAGVAASGTVYCDANLGIPSNSVSGVPSGWARSTL